MPSFSINYPAVVVAAVAAFVIGMVWYSPVLFARQWMAAQGYTPEKMAAMRQGMAKTYAVSFLCFLVTAWVMAVLTDRLGVGTPLGGVKLGGLVWLGFAATIGLMANLYSDKPRAAYFIDAGYQLVYLVVTGVILAVWR
jgi:hypothetical protein